MKHWVRTIALAGLAASLSASAARADAERDSETETGWWWFTSATETQINDKRAEGYRIIKLAVVDNNPMRFAAVLVRNLGEYYNPQDGWWFDLTYGDMEAILSPTVRALQIYPYLNSGGSLRYAVVLVTNTGQYAKGWWWHHNTDLAGIQSIASNQNMRLVAWERRPNEGARFSCVFVSNTGDDQRDWWPYPGVSSGTLNNLLSQHNARVTDLTYLGNGQYDAVLEQLEGQRWWWASGYTSSQVSILYGNRAARIYDLQPAGAGEYAVLMINNGNALEERISVIMRTIMGNETLAPLGASLKRVNGSYRAAIHHDRIFDPASTIKVLHHVHAMKQVALGNIGFTQLINVNGFDGAPGGCPPESPDQLEPLDDVLRAMMEQSDNVRTEAIKDRFGQANINATADALNMPDTELVRRIGCGGEHNMMTLADLSELHEAVANGYLDDVAGDWRDEFYDLMINSNGSAMAYGGAAGYPDVGGIIDEEAAEIGLPDAKRLAFRAAVEFASKGGSVGLDGLEYRSSFAWFSIPYMSGGVIDPREFVTGAFVDDAVSGTNAGNAVTAASAEILRDELAAALATWLTPATLSLTPASGFSTSGPQGGPFTPNSRTYTLSNTGDQTMNWSTSENLSWVRVLPAAGSLPAGGQTLVTIYTDTPINNLSPGYYAGSVQFLNTTNGTGNTSRPVEVTVTPPPPPPPGDLNCDGSLDFFDIDPFLMALFDPAAYARAFPNCNISAADINGDRSVDFFDIDPFLDCLFNGCP